MINQNSNHINPSNPDSTHSKQLNQNVGDYGLLVLMITVAWLAIWYLYGSLKNIASEPFQNWFFYDMPYVMAWIKSFGDGGLIHPTLSINQFLNAPFVANWNDFPGEDLAFTIPGQLSKVFGLFLGTNLYLLLMQILCGVCFYFVGRSFNYQRIWSMVGALIYAFAPTIFYRGIGHISLASIWYVPLMIFTFVWLNYPEKIKLSDKNAWRLCIATSIIGGCFNVYYAALYLFILGINWITRFISKDRSSQKIALLIVIVFATEFVQHFNHFLFIWQEGRNPAAMIRDIGTFLIASLTLPDLLLSPAHQGTALNGLFPFAANYYSGFPNYLTTESRLSFIGSVAACGLIALLLQSTYYIFKNKFSQINHWFWLSLGIFAYSITGGLNFILGALGYLLIRSNNRFSIFLMIIGLFFLCEVLSKKTHIRYRGLIAVFAVIFAIWDQVPSQDTALKHALGARSLDNIAPTKELMRDLNSKLEPSAMVFQYPVHPFPEMGSQEGMGDYEQFTPYLFSNHLRFSYGSNKGRDDARWQVNLAKLPILEAISKLQSYGFSAILIHKYGYEDQAKEIIKDIKKAKHELISETPSLIAFKINPAKTPVSPAPEWQIVNSNSLERIDDGVGYQWIINQESQTLTFKRPWYLRLDPQSPYPENPPITLSLESQKDCSVWYQFNQGPETEISLKAKRENNFQLAPKLNQENMLSLKNNCLTKDTSTSSKDLGGLIIRQPVN